ncbi:MAG TPA: serine/threonine-protein kinase [Blastocatellia bacterium]|nr:serine/threonine-protein kinase [Blastocatellia bacterium]
MIGHLVGNYKVTDQIGEGGMGSVFRGIDLMLEREVAIKMLRPELSRQPHIVERFRSEAVTLAKLNHPNIATLYSFLRQGEDFFMVMEFVRGETLDSLIGKSGAMPWERAVALFSQALEGIEHAHKMGIVHRDIKPANMMLTETGSIKVMDFGIARVLGTNRLTKTGHLIGTVEYMSPEQVRGEETDARSDIYSLGILLYEMLTGRVPFNSSSEYELMRSHIEEAPKPPGTFAPQIPLVVEQAIMRALAKKPEARQRSANEFRLMLPQVDEDEVTKPDFTPATTPASYVTNLSDTLFDGSLAGSAVKETRLGDSRTPPAGYAEIKETRLAPDAQMQTVQPGYQQTPSFVAAQPQAAGALASLMSKLSWKHYAGAAAILVALISLPFVLIGGGDKAATTQPATVGQPSKAPPPAPAQDAVSKPNPAQPVIPPAASSTPAPTDVQADNASGSPGSKPTRSARSGGGTTARSSDSTGSRANAQGRSPSQDRESAQDRRSESNKSAAGKKTKTERVAEAAGAVGGAIRGLGGLLNKRKKN